MNIINKEVKHSLSCHLPGMLKVIQEHQLVVLASVVVAREGTLYTTSDDITVLIRVGICITELIEIIKITFVKLQSIHKLILTCLFTCNCIT